MTMHISGPVTGQADLRKELQGAVERAATLRKRVSAGQRNGWKIPPVWVEDVINADERVRRLQLRLAAQLADESSTEVSQ